MFSRVKEIYSYREMIASLVKRDLKGRYKGSVLGFMWTFINPLLQLVVYTMVFSLIMRNGISDYYMFLFVALIPWIFFSTSFSGGSNCVLNEQNMIQKIYFPREVLPISFVTAQFVNMLLSFIVVFIVMIVMGYAFNPLAMICLPVIMLVEFILALGFAMLMSATTVYFRDLGHLAGIVAMAWQFLTPVMYDVSTVPDNLLWVFYLNPMSSVIIAYRDILYFAKVPDLTTLLSAVVVGVVVLIIGWFTFDKLQRRFVEEL